MAEVADAVADLAQDRPSDYPALVEDDENPIEVEEVNPILAAREEDKVNQDDVVDQAMVNDDDDVQSQLSHQSQYGEEYQYRRRNEALRQQGRDELPQSMRFISNGILMMMNSLCFAMLARECKEFELENDESHTERDHVVRMMYLFSLQWLMAAFLNFFNTCQRSERSIWLTYLHDFVLGAMFGVIIVIFCSYGQGFVTPAQDENTIVRIIAFCLNCFGVLVYIALLWVTCALCFLVREQSLANQRRLALVQKLQGIPFGRLAINIEMTCAICMTNFASEDSVVQLKCDHRHIFHKDCLTPWIETPSIDRPVAQCPLCKKPIIAE